MVTALWLPSGCSLEAPASLRVGINPWPVYEFLYLAQEKGFYREAGLNVRLVEFSSLSDARRAYERGQIDVLASTVIEVLQARDNSSRSPQIVQVLDYSNGADVILTRPGLTNVSGLRGGRIGLEPASLGVYVLARALEEHRASLADVQLRFMDQLAMEDAFRKGEVDAVVTYPPTSIKLLRDGRAVPVFSTAEIPGEVIDVISAEADLIKGRPADVTKLLRGYYRAMAYAQDHPAEAHRIMAAREGITADELRTSLSEGIRVLSESDQVAYLRPGGRLEVTVAVSDRILRACGQVKGPDRRADVFTAAFAGKGPTP